MKDWKTSLLGLIGATTLFLTAKGFIDTDLATYIGTVIAAVFGIVASDGEKED